MEKQYVERGIGRVRESEVRIGRDRERQRATVRQGEVETARGGIEN